MLKSTSTLISEHRSRLRSVLLGTLLLAVAGCAEFDSLLADAPVAPVEDTTITVSRSAVTITGPRGFCVDPQATRDRSGDAFVLLGNCAAITRTTDVAQPRIHALLTAAVRETDVITVAEEADRLAAFLRSETGRTMLSRAKDPETVDILETFQRGDVLYVHARDESDGYAPGMAPDHWRAIFDLNGRIVSLAVLSFEADPISPQVGLRTVRNFATQIRTQNVPEQ